MEEEGKPAEVSETTEEQPETTTQEATNPEQTSEVENKDGQAANDDPKQEETSPAEDATGSAEVNEGEEVKVDDNETKSTPETEEQQATGEAEVGETQADVPPTEEGESQEGAVAAEVTPGEETAKETEDGQPEAELTDIKEGDEAAPVEGDAAPVEGDAPPAGEQVPTEGEENAETPKSPLPQSDTFTEGERAESPVPQTVGEKLSREPTPSFDETSRQDTQTELLVPGTPEIPGTDTEGETGPDTQQVEEMSPEPEFDREFLIEKYNAALAEREQLKQQNYQLQHKLAEYFRKKKSDDRADYDKNVTDQEQRYLKYMDQLQELQKQAKREKENYRLQISDLNDKCMERKERVDEEKKKFIDFKQQVALNSLNSRSGKSIPPKDIEQYIANEEKKEAEVVFVRLENIRSKNKLKKKEQQLKSKEELAEGLHLIDFEQLKIENQTYNEKIEERNEELLKLRKKITSTVQVLTHLKEKLQFVQAENQVQKKKLQDVESFVGQKRDILSRTKQARDSLRIDNHRLRQNCGLLGNEPLLRDFEERKDESDDLKIKLEELRSLHAELALNCNQVRRKIEQARMGQA
ncbi:coiled-coil domain-containing protein 96 isoform X2 [Patella vulgata]|uniref:coiled-coil domain-containing protein 96 isoform X2 n=1 Tax=Patella vulgata TaxID=6465 RepID=UPI0024A922E6|nr:coiled-coil domain-containing protein 96 isoform X2 [Patella vulgata]